MYSLTKFSQNKRKSLASKDFQNKVKEVPLNIFCSEKYNQCILNVFHFSKFYLSAFEIDVGWHLQKCIELKMIQTQHIRI